MTRTSVLSLLSVPAFFTVVAFWRTSPAAADAAFLGLGVSEARGISADGSVVVGGGWALHWEDGVMVDLGSLPGGA